MRNPHNDGIGIITNDNDSRYRSYIVELVLLFILADPPPAGQPVAVGGSSSQVVPVPLYFGYLQAVCFLLIGSFEIFILACYRCISTVNPPSLGLRPLARLLVPRECYIISTTSLSHTISSIRLGRF